MPHICETCRHARKFDFPPTPDGAEDGVHCKSPQMVDVHRDCATDDSALLWRVEILADDAHCPYWASVN